MRKLSKLVLLFLIAFIGNAFSMDAKLQHEMSILKDVSVIINAFKQQDKVAIAELISYPLKRRYPIPSIKNKAELVDRFDEVFDKSLVISIANSNAEADWKEMGWRGVMFSNGKVWMDFGGLIRAINYQTKKEKQIAIALIAAERKALHSNIKEYEYPVLEWKTARFHIRIDRMESRNYRYAAWDVEQDTKEKPDLVLLNGTVNYIGSGGNHYYLFKNGNYTYRCDVTVLGKDDSPPGILSVFKGEERILNEPVIETVKR